jgi:YebC/PmpR family DNA-binding regulatory protein
MSGHSKWSKIKRAKGIKDTKKGALFTKMARDISTAAQEGGGDPDMNFTLRLAINKAKQANMLLDNIERAIKKGTGELKDGAVTEKITYEFITSFGVQGLIDCATDNKNRTVTEMKNIIDRAGHKLADPGSVSWGFKEEGHIELGAALLKKSEKYGQDDTYENADVEALEELILDTDGVIDYEAYKGSDDPDFEADDTMPADRTYITVRVERDTLKASSEKFSNAGWQVLESQIVKLPDSKVAVDDEHREKLENFIEALEENDDVDSVWTNVAD